MGLAEKLKEYEAQKFVFELPDGEEIYLRPVKTVEVLPRLGVAPDAVGRFLASGSQAQDPSSLDPSELPHAAMIGERLQEAFLVFGITNVPLCFTHEALEGKCEGKVPVEAFRAYIKETYGPEVLAELERRIREVSGEIRAEEVAQDKDSFREVDAGAPPHGKDVRDEPDRAPEPAAG